VSLPIVVAGLGTGALYATSALALSVTYRVARVLNLAQGSVALLAATTAARLDGLPHPIAIVIALAVAGAAGLGLEISTRSPDPLARLTAVTGWLLVLSGVLGFGLFADVVPLFALGRGTVRVGGVAIGYDTALLILLAVVIPVLLERWLATTHRGALVIAVADAPESAATLGLDVISVRRSVWFASQVVVGLVGVLAAPTQGLEPITALVLLSGGLAAGLIGGIDRLVGPVIVGFALGVAAAVLGGQVAPAFVDALLVSVVVVALAMRRTVGGALTEARV
jgi:branched-subunit amino acid ABC-type transport system permease component